MNPDDCDVRAPLGIPAGGLTLPMLKRAEIHQLLSGKSWRVLLQDEQILAELRNFRIVCGQWCSGDGPAIKTHIRRTHMHVWNFLHPPRKLCLSFQASLLDLLVKAGHG